MNRLKLLLTLVLSVTCTQTWAADCNVVSRSSQLVLMQCDASSDRNVWLAAAKTVCESDQRCNVWFWPAGVRLPAVAPSRDQDLPRHLTSQALAVWANDSSSLLELKAAKKSD